jgi:hypothetical protein
LWVGKRLAVYVQVFKREDKRSGREKEAEEKFVDPL